MAYKQRLFTVVYVVVLLLNLSVVSVLAEQNLNFGNDVKIVDADVRPGHIIITSEKGFIKSRVPYSQSMTGVVVSEAGVAFESQEQQEGGYYPVVFSGTAKVLVSGENGPIRKGDFITSSSLPGVGMKATHSGPMLGIALADFQGQTKDDVGRLPVTLNIKYVSVRASVNSRFRNVFDLAKMAAYEEPLIAFKYIVAALSVILSFVFAFLHFGRVSAKGIEALGRNPLASRVIQFGIVFNILIGIGIMVTGVAVGLLVLRF